MHGARTPAMLLGVGAAGTGIASSLVSEGVVSIGVCRGRDDWLRFSGRVRHALVARDDTDEALSALVEEECLLLKDRPVAYPTTDEEVQLLYRKRNRLLPLLDFHWLAQDGVARMVDTVVETRREADLARPEAEKRQWPRFWCSALVNRSGHVAAACTVREIRCSSTKFGDLSLGRIDHDELVVDETTRFLRSFEYRGLATVEVRHRPGDHGAQVFGVYPHLPAWTRLFASAGVNLPYLAYQDLRGRPHEGPMAAPRKSGVYWARVDHGSDWFVLGDGLPRVGLRERIRAALDAASSVWRHEHVLAPMAQPQWPEDAILEAAARKRLNTGAQLHP